MKSKVKFTYLVSYKKSCSVNKSATLYNCFDGKWFINYIGVDGLGYSSFIEELDPTEAKGLIF